MVAAADIFHRYGISLPDLSQENIDELKELIPATWMMMRNPVDVSAMGSPKAGVRLREMLFENYTTVISVYLKTASIHGTTSDALLLLRHTISISYNSLYIKFIN